MTGKGKTEEKRGESPYGTLLFSGGLIEDAYHIFEGKREISVSAENFISRGVLILLSQALEIQLKAFLMSRGFTAELLKSKKHGYGHDLCQLLATSKAKGISDFLKGYQLEDYERVIYQVNDYHKNRDFMYHKTGGYRIPRYDFFHNTLVNIYNGLLSACSDEEWQHSEKFKMERIPYKPYHSDNEDLFAEYEKGQAVFENIEKMWNEAERDDSGDSNLFRNEKELRSLADEFLKHCNNMVNILKEEEHGFFTGKFLEEEYWLCRDSLSRTDVNLLSACRLLKKNMARVSTPCFYRCLF